MRAVIDISTRMPIDATAGRVISSGTHFDNYPKNSGTLESDFPLPMKPVPENLAHYVGTRIGRLVAIWPYQAETKKKSMLWVCRCDCGRYTTRRTRSLVNEENKGDRCEHCRKIAQIRRNHLYRASGKECDVREL